MEQQSILNGLTPEQIRKAIYGKSNEEKESLKLNNKKIKSKKPIKAIRESQNHDLGMLLSLPFTTTATASEYKTPEWFRNKEKADVSVIVPIYNTNAKNIINSWNKSHNGMKVEIIFIEDNCPVDSKDLIIKECENKNIIGKIYTSSMTQGWSACCNIGAEKATGEILVFLHPDIILTTGWLRPMTRLLRKQEIGVVGALVIDQDGRTYSDAGFEWNWESESFLSLGKEIYKGNKISKPFTIDNTPSDLLASGEVDNLNGKIIAVRRADYMLNGGMSPNLNSIEWATADFCMSLKEKGLKVISQRTSHVILNDFLKKDRNYKQGSVFFDNKWIKSGRLDNIVSSKRQFDEKKINSIVIRRRSAHGDVLIASGVAAALKKKYPKSQIIFNTDCPEVLKNNPFIDKVVESCSERWFDLYFDLDMVYEYRPDCNILTSYAEACGVAVDDCEFYLNSKETEQKLPENYAVIHAGKTMWAGRNWSYVKFNQISNKLKSLGLKVVIIGTYSDCKTSVCDLDLRGLTDVDQLSYVINNCKLFVGIDSFPMHVAQVLKKPGVCFFGSIKPETRIIKGSKIKSVYANGLKCIGCHHRKSTPCTATTSCEVGIQDCINNVTVDQMWSAILECCS